MDHEVSPKEAALRGQGIDFLLSWATRVSAVSEELNRESISQGYITPELLCSLCEKHFDGSFVEDIQNDSDLSKTASVSRIEIIRKRIHAFYLEKFGYDLENAPFLFAPATDIVDKDEDALLNFLFLIYGISIALNNNSTRTFTQMLEATSEEFQTFMEKKQSAFVNQMKGNNQIDHSETIKELKSKLQEKSEQVVKLQDKVSHLEFELNTQKEELDRYAESKLISQEYQRKHSQSQELEKQVKEQDEIIHKMEFCLKERESFVESLAQENSRLKSQIEDIREELRDVKDEKAAAEHRLLSAESSAAEYEQKYNRLREANREQPSKREYEILLERNAKHVKLIDELEQQKKPLESINMILSSKEAQLEQKNREHDELLKKFLSLENSYKDLKEICKKLESSRPSSQKTDNENIDESIESLHSSAPELAAEQQSEQLVKLQVNLQRLESDKKAVEQELEQQKIYAEKEKKDIFVQVAKFRAENEQLAIKFETAKNELFKLKSSVASMEDKCKRLEDDRNALKTQNAAHEQTIKRAGIIISEYVCQNEDGSSVGMSGSEVLQLRTDVKRLEEQLRQKRSQSDAFRHIATEEQRLITTEWYEQASQHLRQKYLKSTSSLSNGDRSLPTPDQFSYTTQSHLSDLQNSARVINSSTSSTPNSSMSNSINAENPTVMGQMRSFLGLQRDLHHRTPARWHESPNAQPIPRPKISPSNIHRSLI